MKQRRVEHPRLAGAGSAASIQQSRSIQHPRLAGAGSAVSIQPRSSLGDPIVPDGAPEKSLGSPIRLDGARPADIRKLLERLARRPFEKCEREWRALLRELRLGLVHSVPMGEILREGKWRDKKNPLGYVRQAGVRRAIRMGLVIRDGRPKREVLGCELSYTDREGKKLGHDENLDMAQHACEMKHYVSPWQANIIDRVHRTLLTKDLEVDWEMVADLAGLDDAETTVLMQQAMGLGRKLALKGCFGVADRRIIEAAWRRLNRAKKSLRKVLETGHPSGRRPDESGPKMLFLLEDDGGLKIFFAKDVPGGPEMCT